MPSLERSSFYINITIVKDFFQAAFLQNNPSSGREERTMNKTEERLEEEVFQYNGITSDNFYDLEQACMALNELLGNYQWDYEPTPQKAMEFLSAVGENVEKCSDEAKWSGEYIHGYKKIMWLIRIARDYCSSALERCQNVYYEGLLSE